MAMGNTKRFEVKAARWPWQPGYNWHGMLSSAPLNQPRAGDKAAPRFGGGWKFALGFEASTSALGGTVLLNLLYGMVTIRWRTSKGMQAEREYQEGRERIRQELEASRVRRLAEDAAWEAERAEREQARAAKEAARRAALTPDQRAEEDELPF